MNQPVNQSNPLDLASINARLMADKACDEIEKLLLAGESVNWSAAFAKVDSSIWETLVHYLIDFLRRSEIVDSDASILSLFEKAPSEIRQLVARQLAVTVQNMDAESVEDLPSQVAENFVPDVIEHFQIKKQIGLGGFGRVLLAQDMLLQKEVVLKIPRRSAISNGKNLNAFIDEARKASMVESKGIVPIFHIGTYSGVPYIVQPYIRGGDLHQALANRRFTFYETASIVAEIATTIAEAHQKRLLHRDLKPANILLDEQGRPLVADFGLAIHESRQYEARGEFAGSINYMSPEQVNGETHHMDGRSDIWSLGVILYQMLVNDLPFRAPNKSLLRAKICQQPPRPPRQLNRDVPQELERICLKCLSIRMTDRYGNGHDLALDLREWLTASQSADAGQSKSFEPGRVNDFLPPSSIPQSVVPRGLMAFSDQDEAFFLSLLPGARTRDGVPEQLQYWLERISQVQDRPTFSVGLIYGPSGCGKSSFVKAGLLPRLPRKVHRIYLESTDSDTEARLLLALRKYFPDIPHHLELPDVLAALREGDWLQPDEKLLIVLDQFEQWLHTHEIQAGLPLIEALRQCDGIRLQAVVLVRDDFWMKVTQFFHALEIQISQLENYHGLDLFDTQHAKRVLAAFGRAYERLPADGSLTASEEQFLDEAIKRLVERDKIICIHLVMLAETVKNKPWAVDSLPRSAHLHQIGVQFLEQCLSSRSTNPAFRFYHSAICRVLSVMLPVEGTDIKARFRNREQLAIASGYSVDSKEFSALLDILEKQLKLISAADPEVSQSKADAQNQKSTDARYYQLTHDFLVPSVRQWLEQLQSETPAGRAKLRLKSLASGYEQSSDNRFLPTLLEFIDIARHVRVATCEQREKRVYWKAFSRYSTQALLGICCLVFLAGIGYRTRLRVLDQRAKDWVTTWMNADGSALPAVLSSLQVENSLAVIALKECESSRQLSNDQLLRVDLAKALLGGASDEALERLARYVEHASFTEVPLLRKAIQTKVSITRGLLETAFAEAVSDEQAVKTALVLFHMGERSRLEQCLEVHADQFRHLIAIHSIGDDLDDAEHFIEAIESFHDRKSIQEIDQLSGMVKGLGRRNWSKSSSELKDRWKALLISLFNKSPSGPMHSAAEFSLSKLSEYPELLLSKDAPVGPNDAKNWFVAKNGMTFVKVPAKGKKLGIEVLKFDFDLGGDVSVEMDKLDDFWISATETPASLYLSVLGGSPNPNGRDTTGTMPPITQISVIDAMRFCNELSIAENLAPYYVELSEPFKLEASEGMLTSETQKRIASLKAWTVDRSSNGYRMPFLVEAFYCACAQSSLAFPTSLEARAIVGHYCWYSENVESSGSNRVHPIRQLMPNDMGMYDIVGNAAELSIETRSERLGSTHYRLRPNIDSTIKVISHPHQSPLDLWSVMDNVSSFRVVRNVGKDRL